MAEELTGVADTAVCALEEKPTSSGDEVGSDADASPDAGDEPIGEEETVSGRRRRLPRRWFDRAGLLAWIVLPALAFLLAVAAAFLDWRDGTVRDADLAGAQAGQAAQEGTTAMLSYKPETVEKDLTAARDYLTGSFRDSYTSLTNDVVIPGAKQQRISAVARVPATATVSASWNHAVVLVFVDQTTVIGDGPPTDMASTVRVKLDKVGDKWLISEFEPI